jgi:cytoskeletal protein CcmA (bactofilin family)
MALSEATTIIGESIVVSGNLNGDEDLTVRGRVEGTVTLTKTLVVEPSGVVKAEVQVKNLVISGAVVGNVTASESVEITKEGRMVGDIAAPRVIIVDGATFRGRIDMGEIDVEAAERPALARASSRPALRPPPRAAAPRATERKDGAAAVSDEGEERASLAERAAAAVKPPPPPPVPVAMGAVKRKVIVRRK